MKKYSGFFLIVFLIATTSVFARVDIEKDIEKRQSDCTDMDSSTQGMTNCAEAAYKEWDRELNKAYKQLINLLPESKKLALKESQRAWLKYRDLEFKSLEGIYGELDGTMYIPMSVESRTRVVRERALQLRNCIDLLSEGR